MKARKGPPNEPNCVLSTVFTFSSWERQKLGEAHLKTRLDIFSSQGDSNWIKKGIFKKGNSVYSGRLTSFGKKVSYSIGDYNNAKNSSSMH